MPTTVRCFWMRLANCCWRCKPNYFRVLQYEKIFSTRRRRSWCLRVDVCGCWRRPTVTCVKRCWRAFSRRSVPASARVKLSLLRRCGAEKRRDDVVLLAAICEQCRLRLGLSRVVLSPGARAPPFASTWLAGQRPGTGNTPFTVRLYSGESLIPAVG
ncbi:hypothetical protein KCP69_08705 [Salmonella enterica subsp. enterica]|nr:hypothetical protein KCP69_08705 [Salmonella enterica subsp. enterica]